MERMETNFVNNVKEVVEERVRATFCPDNVNQAASAFESLSHSLIEIHEAYKDETHINKPFQKEN